jgi:hypothetical protein
MQTVCSISSNRRPTLKKLRRVRGIERVPLVSSRAILVVLIGNVPVCVLKRAWAIRIVPHIPVSLLAEAPIPIPIPVRSRETLGVVFVHI